MWCSEGILVFSYNPVLKIVPIRKISVIITFWFSTPHSQNVLEKKAREGCWAFSSNTFEKVRNHRKTHSNKAIVFIQYGILPIKGLPHCPSIKVNSVTCKISWTPGVISRCVSCAHTSVCMYICVHASLCVCMCASMLVCVHASCVYTIWKCMHAYNYSPITDAVF